MSSHASRPYWQPSFLRTSDGAELDLILSRAGRMEVFEFKASKAPSPSRGFFQLIEDLKPQKVWVVAPVDGPWPVRGGAWVTDLASVCLAGPPPPP